jgi:hypothetical protein
MRAVRDGNVGIDVEQLDSGLPVRSAAGGKEKEAANRNGEQQEFDEP